MTVPTLALLVLTANAAASQDAPVDTQGWIAPPLLSAPGSSGTSPGNSEGSSGDVVVGRPATSDPLAPPSSSSRPFPLAGSTLNTSADLSAEVVPRATPSSTHLGVLLDVGVPDGAGVSLVYRPWNWLRLHLGPTTNISSTGIRGGLALVPFHFWITPSLNIDAGYLPPGDANRTVRLFTGDSSFYTPALERISYTFANAHIGLEFGPPRRFTFYLRGGLSYIDGNLGGFQALLQQMDNTLESGDLRLRMTVPSAKVGFIVYFL